MTNLLRLIILKTNAQEKSPGRRCGLHLLSKLSSKHFVLRQIPCVPLATETGLLADRCSVSQGSGALQKHTTYTFLFISHTTNVLLFKFRCNIFVGVRIIKEMPGSVASGTHCTYIGLRVWQLPYTRRKASKTFGKESVIYF